MERVSFGLTAMGTRAKERFAPEGPVVVDASVVVEYLVDLGHAAAATRVVRSGLDTAAELWAPDLVFSEVASAASRLVRKKAISVAEGTRVVRQLAQLPLQVTTTGPLIEEAWQMRERLTIYDACYAVLARRLGGCLVTGDKKLARAVRGGKLRVWTLDEIQ